MRPPSVRRDETKRAAALATAMVVLAMPCAAAHAEGRVDCATAHCLALGLRTGVGIGFGSITEGETLSDRAGGLLLVGLDAGYRIAGLVDVGLDGSAARVALKKSSLSAAAVTGPGPCFQGTSCSASLYRAGLFARVHFLPHASFDPWVGLGAGYEILTISETGQTPSPEGPITFDAVSISLRGLEYARLEVGGEAPLGSAFTLGPFLSFSLARYGSSRTAGTISVANETLSLDSHSSREIVTTTFHEWMVFGVRGTFAVHD